MSDSSHPVVLWASTKTPGDHSWCKHVTGGEEAVRAFKAGQFELVICDMRGLSDNMSGIRIYQALKTLRDDVKMVLMTPGYVGAPELTVAGGKVRVIASGDRELRTIIKEALKRTRK